jgi:hypothetical protein
MRASPRRAAAVSRSGRSSRHRMKCERWFCHAPFFVKVRIPVGYIFKAENGTPWFCEQDQTGSRTPPATKMAHGEGRGRLEEREEFPAEFEVREVVLP